MILKSYCAPWGQMLADGCEISLDSPGLRLIEGENGSGKTSLLEHMLFGEGADLAFPDSEEEKRFREHPETLFAYVPQEDVRSQVTVGEYVEAASPLLSGEAFKRFSTRFGLDELDERCRIRYLSGGEMKRLSLALALSKRVPYVFLDEPSNHLDDAGACALSEILGELSESRCVVVITHDTRLSLQPCGTYVVDRDVIWERPSLGQTDGGRPAGRVDERCSSGQADGRDSSSQTETHDALWPWMPDIPNMKKHACALGRRLQNGATLWVTRGLALVFLANVLLWGYVQLESSGVIMPQVPENAILLSGVMGGDYTEFNEGYCRAAGVSIPEEGQETNVTFADLEAVAALDGVSGVYAEDPNASAEQLPQSENTLDVLDSQVLDAAVSAGGYASYDASRFDSEAENQVICAVVQVDSEKQAQVTKELVKMFPAAYVGSASFFDLYVSQANRDLFIQVGWQALLVSALGAWLLIVLRQGTLSEALVRLQELRHFFVGNLGIANCSLGWGMLFDAAPLAAVLVAVLIGAGTYGGALALVGLASVFVLLAPAGVAWTLALRKAKV